MYTFKYGDISTLTLSERITTPSIHIQKDDNHWYVPLFKGDKDSVVQSGDYNYTLGGLKVGNFRVAINRKKGQEYLSLIADNFYTFEDGVLSCTNNPTITKCDIHEVDNYGLHCAFYNCTGLTGSISFPSLTSIGDSGLYDTFCSCVRLTSVSFPSLTSIGSYGLCYAFFKCTELTSVSFPSLTSISDHGLYVAFFNCTGLTSVSFPRLTSIGDSGLYDAFYGCTGLKEVHFKSSLSGNFQCTTSNMGCSNATIYFDL